MLASDKKNIRLSKIETNKNVISVSCSIPNYKEIRENISVGESITTNEAFELNFNDVTSKWKIIFFPNGQYDFDGVASNNWRFYIKLISSDKDQDIKMGIKICLSTLMVSTASQNGNTSVFRPYNNYKSWAGPFQMDCIDENLLGDVLLITCIFNINPNEVNSKRRSSEFDFPYLTSRLNAFKKNRPSLLSEENKDTQDQSFEDSPKPFHLKSPLPQRLRCFSDRSSLGTFNENSMDSHKQNEARTKFQNRSRTLIFSREERQTCRSLQVKCSRLSDVNKQNLQPNTWNSSECLTVADIESKNSYKTQESESGSNQPHEQ